MFAVVNAFVCFHHAERILSAIREVSCSPLWGRKGRAEMGERRSRGRKWSGKDEGREMGVQEKIAQKRNRFETLGTLLGGYRPVSYIFWKAIFWDDNHFHRIADNMPPMLNRLKVIELQS